MINYELVKAALAEDLAGGVDVTSVATIAADAELQAEFVARDSGVVAGIEMAKAVLIEVGVTGIEVLVADGALVKTDDVLIRVSGNARAILLAERTALNFLGHLSGIATLTSNWVAAITGTNCEIRDTRKTTPGWRELEKFAVRMGGAINHRITLSESAIIKDNHILSTGSITAAYKAIKKAYPNKSIEIEVDSLEQFTEALTLKPDLILLDNMSVEMCLQAVEQNKGSVKLEASGGLSLKNAKAYANTGVDYLAVGALTHSAPALDIGLDFRKDK